MDSKERVELVTTVLELLQNVIGASGKAEELVKLTTQIVQSAKKLTEGTTEATRTRTTATLAEFVKAARNIAKDARAVDSSSLQKLSATKRAVETLVKELDEFHASQAPSKRPKDDIEVSLSELVEKRSSPPGTPASERERKLLDEMKRQQRLLMQKKVPQRAPKQHGEPEDVLKMAASGLTSSATELVELAGQKNPSKEALLEPAVLMAKMVSILMDLVDSLFVSKYPMRAQAHSFCSTLIESILAYKAQPKSLDATSLKTIGTQIPALQNALEVMGEQCTIRMQDLKGNIEMSIQRKVALKELDVFGQSPRSSPAPRRKKVPEKQPEKTEFEICCIVCTSAAVDGKTQRLINKGSELTMMVSPTTTVLDVRKDLSARMTLPLDHIQLRFRGDDVLTDNVAMTPNNPVPYFIFNLHEPSEEELKEFKKDQHKKTRVTIETINWTALSNAVAVALFDYEALGEESEDGNLAFAEGDIIEIIEKSRDGWWTGCLNGGAGVTGVFPASFVEEIQEPGSKEELKKLVKRFRDKTRSPPARAPVVETQTMSFDDLEESQPPKARRPPQLQVAKSTSGSKLAGMMKRSNHHSETSEGSPSPTKKGPPRFEKRASEPNFSQFQQPLSPTSAKPKGGKRLTGIFKKRTAHSYTPGSEAESSQELFPKPRSPILSSPANRKRQQHMSLPDEAAPDTTRRPLIRPASAPRLSKMSQIPELSRSELRSSPRPRRPPPPVPRPYADTHRESKFLQQQHSGDNDNDRSEDDTGNRISFSSPEEDSKPAFKLGSGGMSPPAILIPPVRAQEDSAGESSSSSREKEDDNLLLPPPSDGMKASSSMEELFKNLEAFDATQEVLEWKESNNFLSKEQEGEREYATIPRSELPVRPEKKEPNSNSVSEELSPSPPLPPRINVSESESPPVPVPRSGSNSKPYTRAKPLPPPKPKEMLPGKPRPPPKMVENGLDGDRRSESPTPPVPPPRRKSKKMRDKMERSEEEHRERLEGGEREERSSNPRPARSAGPGPSLISREKKMKTARGRLEILEQQHPSSAPASRTASPDELLPNSGASGLTREGSASTTALGPDHLSRSPILQRRTNTVVSSNSRDPLFSDDDLEGCTGIGKEGILHKEGTSFRDRGWKARYFNLLSDRLIYFEVDSYSEDSKPLGQISVRRMQGAVSVGEKNDFHCLAINMRYDTSVVLGAHTKVEREDWVKSINKMIKTAKSEGGANTYALCFKTAVKCITYLSVGSRPREDRAFTALGGNMGRVNRWLECIDRGEDPDLSDMPNTITAVCLLRYLFKAGRLGTLVAHDITMELCELVKSTSPVSVLGSKLEQLRNDSRGLFKQLLRLFGQVLEYSDRNHTDVADLNKIFSPLLFEKVSLAQSEPLLAYLISTCELIIS